MLFIIFCGECVATHSRNGAIYNRPKIIEGREALLDQVNGALQATYSLDKMGELNALCRQLGHLIMPRQH